MTAQMQLQDGKVKWKISKCRLLTKNLWDSMEEQLNLSGIFSQDFHHCRFFKSSRKFCKDETSNLKNSQTGSYLCQCSTEIRHHLVNVQTLKKSLQNFVRRRREPFLRDTPFSFLCSCRSPNSTASGATISTIRRTARRNWKHGETSCQVCQLCFITGELLAFLCLKIGGKIGARREIAAHISFFQILGLRFRKIAISMHAREGVNSTPTTVASHATVLLARVAPDTTYFGL